VSYQLRPGFFYPLGSLAVLGKKLGQDRLDSICQDFGDHLIDKIA
jgi:hypothetical protein